MSNYVIKKDNDSKEIVYMEYELEGYKFKPKKNEETVVKVDQIMIINPSLADKILTIKFNNHYQKILKLLYYILNSDDADDSNVTLALNEVAKLRAQIFNKYQAYLSYERQMTMLNKLRDLENKLKFKNQFIVNNYENVNSSRRSM